MVRQKAVRYDTIHLSPFERAHLNEISIVIEARMTQVEAKEVPLGDGRPD